MMHLTQKPATVRTGKHWRWLLILLLYAVLLGGYWVLRYGTLWTETDTSSLTQQIETVRVGGELLPPGQKLYPHGFNYQAVSVILLAATGIPVQALQTIVYPLLATGILALVAFAFYSRLTRKGTLAVLAVLFLLFQADVLFVILRGSHEKLDWPLMMVALTLLCLSLDRPARKLAIYVPLFYLVVFAMIATNLFFASSFVVALTLGLVLGTLLPVLLRRRSPATAGLRRLVYISLSCLVLSFIFMFYIYPPSLHNLLVLGYTVDKVGVLVLGFEAQGDPYGYISYGWVSPQAYLGLSLYTWLLVLLSFLEWSRRGVQFLVGVRRLEMREDLDWLLYAGFALQVAAAIIVDLSGAIAANLQLRLFPAFSVLAAALLARGVVRLVSAPWFHGWTRRIVLAIAALAVAWFGVASLLKATNEPALSNKWGFYGRSEAEAVRWVDGHLQLSYVWTGIDERIREVFRFRYAGGSESENVYDAYDLKPWDRHVLFSERESLRATRMGIAMPAVRDWNRVYDNGDVHLFHQRPRTPYQR